MTTRFKQVRRALEMGQLYRQPWRPFSDRLGLLKTKLEVYHLRMGRGTNSIDVLATPGSGDVRVINEMFLEEPYWRGVSSDMLAGSKVLDIGANRGYFALNALLAHHVELVHSYEPEPSNATSYRVNLAANVPKTAYRLHEAAVTPSSAGRVFLHLGDEAGHHSLIEAEGKRDSVEVETSDIRRALDELRSAGSRDAPIIVKIDTEGTEHALLGALSQDDVRSVAYIAAETAYEPSDATERHLESLGFRCTVDQPYLFAVPSMISR